MYILYIGSTRNTISTTSTIRGIKMKVIVIANQKGGIGKTTTACNVANILMKMGKKTLLLDCDMQGNSSDSYKCKIEGEATLYDVILEEERIPIYEAIQHTENGDIVASDPLLRKADEILNGNIDGLYRLQDALQELEGYEFVILDTAPAMNSILYNALICADAVVIPCTADRYGMQGMSQLFQTIQAVKKRQNKNLSIAGLLLVKYNARTRLSKEVLNDLQEIASQMGTKVFDTKIRESTKAKEAQALRMNLCDYAPKSTTSIDYCNFVEELISEVSK